VPRACRIRRPDGGLARAGQARKKTSDMFAS
jgi:hypothetical protein